MSSRDHHPVMGRPLTKKRCLSSLFILCGSLTLLLVWIVYPYQDMSTWVPLLREVNYSCCQQPEYVREEKILMSDLSSKKWLIVTASVPPTASHLRICKLRGWKTMVICEDAYSSIWRENGCQYNSNYYLKNTILRSGKFLPYYEDFHITKTIQKNMAMLSAVADGVDIVVDLEADDLDSFLDLDLNREWFLVYNQNQIFNPFSHFSYSYNQTLKIPYRISSKTYPQIHSVMPNVNHVRNPNETHSHRFDHQAPAIATFKGTLVEFIPRTRVYKRNSMWAMFSLPVTTRSNHLCHHQLQQRFLWEINGYYVIHPSIKEDFSSEILPRNSTKKSCGQILMSTNCAPNTNLLNCFRQIIGRLVVHGILSEIHREIFEMWILDLHMISYNFPSRELGDNNYDSKSIIVDYAPKFNSIPNSDLLSSHCSPRFDSQSVTPKINENTLLLIVFNIPIYKYVNWIHTMYSSKFRTIVFCGDEKTKFDREAGSLGNTLTFIEQNVQKGYHIYICVTAALKMQYNVTGVLMVSDDVLLNVWNTDVLPKNKAWLHQVYKVDRGEKHNWYNWYQRWGQAAVLSAWKNISELTYSSPSIRKSFQKFNTRLKILTKSPKGLCFGFQDIFYIPRRTFQDFIFYGDIFEKHNMFLEIAIPTIIMGSLDREDVVMIQGSYLWDHDRTNYEKFFNINHIFLHPFKFGLELKKPESLIFLCKKYFPLLF